MIALTKKSWITVGVIILTAVVYLMLSFSAKESVDGTSLTNIDQGEQGQKLHTARADQGTTPAHKNDLLHDQAWFLEQISHRSTKENPAQFLQNVIASLGSGLDRQNLIAAFFAETDMPLADAFKLIKEHLNEEERNQAERALEFRIALITSDQELQNLANGLYQFTERELNVIQSGLALRINPEMSSSSQAYAKNHNLTRTSEQMSQTFSQVYGLMKNLIANQTPSYQLESYELFLRNAGLSVPYQAWQEMQNLSATFPTMLNNDKLRTLLVNGMTDQNPAKVYDLLSTSNYGNNTKAKAADLNAFYQGWLAKEPKSAAAWLSKNFPSFDQTTKDSFNSAVVSHLLQSNSLQEAWKNVDKITDPAIKKQAEGQVWSKERDMVRNAVNKNPQQAITELVSGKSQHDAYWIEEAMDVWMAKDFDNAEKWYQDNWKNLPADKAQYAAASFAKQAIKTGDLDVAEQWLPCIQETKTKARIEADIDKALKN
jgi:hypothetical protein